MILIDESWEIFVGFERTKHLKELNFQCWAASTDELCNCPCFEWMTVRVDSSRKISLKIHRFSFSFSSRRARHSNRLVSCTTETIFQTTTPLIHLTIIYSLKRWIRWNMPATRTERREAQREEKERRQLQAVVKWITLEKQIQTIPPTRTDDWWLIDQQSTRRRATSIHDEISLYFKIDRYLVLKTVGFVRVSVDRSSEFVRFEQESIIIMVWLQSRFMFIGHGSTSEPKNPSLIFWLMQDRRER